MLIGRLEQTITHNEKDVEKMENIFLMEIPTELNTSLNTLLNYACGDVFFFIKRRLVPSSIFFIRGRERLS